MRPCIENASLACCDKSDKTYKAYTDTKGWNPPPSLKTLPTHLYMIFYTDLLRK